MDTFSKKRKPVKAISFDNFVEWAKQNTPAPHWAVTIEGINLTHENDGCYLFLSKVGVLLFTKGKYLVLDENGDAGVWPEKEFEQDYELAY